MNSKIIAVDFDGTLCENKWPEIGEANEDMIYYLRKRQAEGDSHAELRSVSGNLSDAEKP